MIKSFRYARSYHGRQELCWLVVREIGQQKGCAHFKGVLTRGGQGLEKYFMYLDVGGASWRILFNDQHNPHVVGIRSPAELQILMFIVFKLLFG